MKRYAPFLILALLLATPAALADGQDAAEAAEAAKAEYTRVAQEAEQARVEAEQARQEATRVAERAREAARRNAEVAREREALREARSAESEQLRAERQQQIELARQELSRAHRELREAQREIAQAHRELAEEESLRHRVRFRSVSERPVIGVILGEATAAGVALDGVSPDGPAAQAGIEAGDVLVTINGTLLAGEHAAGKEAIFEVMEATQAGDEVEIIVDRDGETMNFAVVAEVREPASWQSLVRIPEIRTIRRIEGEPGETQITVETMVVPEIDEEALAERVEILKERLDETGRIFLNTDEQVFFDSEAFVRDFHDYSAFSDHAFDSANVWFGLPGTHGLKLAAVNESLGGYFKTDRGVLVLNVKEDNAYQLLPGDVILKVGGTDVDTPADLTRALRSIDPGDEIEIAIKRDRRGKTLKITMPENRFGYRW